MPPPRLSTLVQSFALAALLSTMLTGCGKKAQIQYEADQLRLSLMELQAQSKKLEGEILAIPLPAQYSSTQTAHLTQLQNYISHTKVDMVNLKVEKEAAKLKADRFEKELNAYRAKY